MALKTILIIALLAGTIASGIFAGISFEDGRRKRGSMLSVLTMVCALTFIVIPFSIRQVDATEVAVVRNMGKIVGTESAGVHFDFWLTNEYQFYDTRIQHEDLDVMTYSSDAQTMTVAMTLQYRIMPDKAIEIAKQYGSLEALEARLSAIVIEKTKATLSSYKAMDIIASRSTISPTVEKTVKEAIDEEFFVNVSAVVITNIDFSDAFELAVEEKMIAEQAKLKADYENQKKVASAEAQAEAQLKTAQAEIEIKKAQAEAIKIEADAQAEANRIISESITESILKSKFYESWDGVLPKVMSDGNILAGISLDDTGE